MRPAFFAVRNGVEIMSSIEIRILGPACIEDYHAHLLRLDASDRALRLVAGNDERGIDGHCLRLLAAQAVLIGVIADGILRAALEIIPDRTGRQAEAILTAEPDATPPAAYPLLIARLVDEARSYRLSEIRLYGLDNPAPAERAALTKDVEVEIGTPVVLRFRQPVPMMAGPNARTSVAA
jgi:hypothetical protein